MAKVSDVLEGIKILNSYYDENSWNIGADYNIIYMYATDRAISIEDLEQLWDLGWNQENCDPEHKEYDKDESWRIYV